MGVHKLQQEQFVKADIERVWAFFSSAANLAILTPAYMNFTVTSGELPADVYAGQIITYTVSPLLGIPLYWMTEITQVVPHKLFVDEQRKGPYKMWHHQHHFIQQGDGVLMRDIVHYQLPLGPLGNIAHTLFVKRQLDDIFEYRRAKINELLG